MQPEFDGDVAISSDSTEELRSNELTDNPFVRGDTYVATVDTSGTVQLRTTGTVRGVMVLDSDVACDVSIYRQKPGLIELKFTPSWQFLDRIDFTVAAQSKNFTFNPDELDPYYKIEGYWLAAGGETSSNLYWYINDSYIDGRTSAGEVTASNAQRSGTLLAYNASGGEKVVVDSKLTRVDDIGLINGLAAHRLSTNVNGTALHGSWYGGTGKITTIGVSANNAGAIDVASYFELFKKREFNKTKVTLWVY